MNLEAKRSREHTKESHELKLGDVEFFLKKVEGLLRNLETRMRILPEVNNEGVSECPFSEKLYAEKEKALKEVVEELTKAPIYKGVIDQEISGLRGNLAKIHADRNRLTLNEPKEKYLVAANATEFHINRNMERRNNLTNLIAKAEEIIDQAKRKTWPLGSPKKVRKISYGTKDQGQKWLGSKWTGPGTRVEIDNLISLGQMRKKSTG